MNRSSCNLGWSAFTVVWGCLLLFFSLSETPPAIPGPFGWDKFEHAVALGIMSYLAALSRQGYLRPARFGFAVGSFFGISIEILQALFTLNRKADPYDIFADMVGAGVAALLYYRLQLRRIK